jgi:outer membrane receptor protein involved in Fe transport
LRGQIGPSNLLVLDGLRYHQATWRTGPNQYLATLDPSTFSALEVLIGPASVAYGSGAIGGVLAAQPPPLPSREGSAGAVTLRGTSADLAAEVWGHVQHRRGALALALGGGWRRFGTLRLGGGERAAISAFQQGGWFARVGYALSARTELRAAWVGSRLLGAGRADQLDKGDLRWYDNADDMAWVELRHRGAGALAELRVAAAAHLSGEGVERVRCKLSDVRAERDACRAGAEALRDDASATPATLVQRHSRNQDDVSSLGGLLQVALRPTATAARDRFALRLGAEVWSDGVLASTARERRTDKGWSWQQAERGAFSTGSRWTELGAFALAEVQALSTHRGALWADAGLRSSHFRASAEGVTGVGDIGYAASGVVGSAALRWIATGWMAYLSFAQGFRAPNLQETTVLGDTGSTFEVPNAALGPERSDSDLPGARLHAAAWAMQLRDAIDTREVQPDELAGLGIDPTAAGDKPVRQRVNAASAALVGGHLSLALPLAGGVTPWARVGWTWGEVERSDGTRGPARRIPPLLGAAGARWRGGPWRIELVGRFAAAQTRLHSGDEGDLRVCADPDAPGKTYKASGEACPGTPGWFDLGLRAGYRVSPALQLDLVGRNLLDARYRLHGSGLDAPGASVSLAATGRFGG